MNSFPYHDDEICWDCDGDGEIFIDGEYITYITCNGLGYFLLGWDYGKDEQ